MYRYICKARSLVYRNTQNTLYTSQRITIVRSIVQPTSNPPNNHPDYAEGRAMIILPFIPSLLLCVYYTCFVLDRIWRDCTMNLEILRRQSRKQMNAVFNNIHCTKGIIIVVLGIIRKSQRGNERNVQVDRTYHRLFFAKLRDILCCDIF